MLPEIDGLEVARTIRKTSNVPIIVLSAKDTEFDKVIGLEIRADDYVTKPFSNRELQARVKALLRRSEFAADPQLENEADTEIVIGDLHILPDAFLVQKGNKRIGLDPSRIWIALSPCDPCRSSDDPWAPSWDGVGLWLLWWCSDSGRTVRRLREKSRDHRDVQNISWPAVVSDIIWETMIDQLKQFVMSSNFVFVLITVGFIIVVALLLLENRRDNIKLRQLNAKIKDLIAGDYSEVVDMQGKSRTDGYDQ